MIAVQHPDAKTTTELKTIDSLTWSSLFEPACKLENVPLALPKKQADMHRKRVAVPITFRLVHSYQFDRSNPLRPPFERIDLQQLGQHEHERELAQDLGKSPLRSWILVPADFCKGIGMPPVALLLASISISDFDAPAASKEAFRLVEGIGGEHPEWACSARLRHDEGLRSRVVASFPYRLLCYAIKLFLEAKARKETFDMDDYIGKRAYMPWTPAILPAFLRVTREDQRVYFAINVTRNVFPPFKDGAQFEVAVGELMTAVRTYQDRHGRDATQNNVTEIEDDWFEALFRRELGNDPAWADHYNRKKFRDAFAAIEGSDGHALDLVHCQSFRVGHLHSVLAVFRRSETILGQCPAHFLTGRLPARDATLHMLKATRYYMVDYDARRGLVYKPTDAPLSDFSDGRLVFLPAMDITVADLRASLQDGRFKEQWLATVLKDIPGLTFSLNTA